MKKDYIKIWLVLALVGLSTMLNAQLKIGNNPQTIHSGSALEIEAVKQGVLYAKVSLNNLTSWQLKGEQVEGMTVYNTNATIGKGFYFWDGSKWTELSDKQKELLKGETGVVAGERGITYNASTKKVGLPQGTKKGQLLRWNGSSWVKTNNIEISTEGVIKAVKFIASEGSSIFPDYVFDTYYEGTNTEKPSYRFRTLAEVEQFIKKNGHLPGFASAEKIKKQGNLDMTATQFLNVEKIEELYLHTIEQAKELKTKEAKIEELEARLAKIEKMLSK